MMQEARFFQVIKSDKFKPKHKFIHSFVNQLRFSLLLLDLSFEGPVLLLGSFWMALILLLASTS